jgi:hypothetical protein
MPYQEEPKDLPIRFEIETSRDATRAGFVPIVFAGSVKGKRGRAGCLSTDPGFAARAVRRKRGALRRLRSRRSRSYTRPALDRSFAWAKVGIDKGLATNPGLGTGLLAGFRTSGDSERPGFGWFFGRDALWSALALHSYGDFASARPRLEFLRGGAARGRQDTSRDLPERPWLPWFTDYPYPWSSADASPCS